MKKVLLVSAMLLVTIFSHAQLIPRAGVSLSTIAFEEEGEDDINSRLGFTLGVGYNIVINEMFSVQPELNYIQKGYKYEYASSDIYYAESGEGFMKLNYVELPILAKFTFGTGTKFFANIGPSFGFGLGGKVEEDWTYTYPGPNGQVTESGTDEGDVKFGDAPDGYEGEDVYVSNRLDIGAQLGFGAIVADKVLIEVRYGLGLTDLDDDFDSKNRVWQFTIGVPINLN